MNIIPKLKVNTPNYWCSWLTQNEVAKQLYNCADEEEKSLVFLGDQGAQKARNVLDENALFGKIGLIYQFPEVRKSLFFMLDDGWDVDYDVHPNKSLSSFGSLSLSEKRFPSCVGNDSERLKQLNEKVKKEGWRGLGIWVCAQKSGEDFDTPFELDKKIYSYWKERILMSKYAGVEYWKVDWGVQCESDGFRKMLTDLGKEFFPELIIEHASCHHPINGDFEKGKTRFIDNEGSKIKFENTAKYSEVFRSYDVTDPLSVSTTLDRVQFLLGINSGLINCEDELYLGAVLGCCVGVMRSKYANPKLDEVIATARWHSIAPAFSGGQINVSKEIKSDEHVFDVKDTWFSPIIGKKVVQSAPRIVARNLQLPTVSGENTPYILLSKNPNGVVSIGAINSSSKNGQNESLPTVSMNVESPEYIGVFGWFDSLKINFEKVPKTIYVQSLIRGDAKEISLCGKELILSYDLLKELHLSTDGSQSAIIVKINY